jgi:hypothetical protein
MRKIGYVPIFVLSGCAMLPESMAPPGLPSAVTVPPGHKEAMTLKAVGTMNYECRARAGMSGAYGWVLNAPDASLRHWSGLRVGRYYGGPTWAYRDGSRLTARLIAASPAGKSAIQLWQASSIEGEGEFSGVTYIQRINATGGELPTAPCTESAVGRGHKVEFAAEFVFYKKS